MLEYRITELHNSIGERECLLELNINGNNVWIKKVFRGENRSRDDWVNLTANQNSPRLYVDVDDFFVNIDINDSVKYRGVEISVGSNMNSLSFGLTLYYDDVTKFRKMLLEVIQEADNRQLW